MTGKNKKMRFPIYLATRVDNEIGDFIKTRADKANMSVSEYLRNEVLKTWVEVIQNAG